LGLSGKTLGVSTSMMRLAGIIAADDRLKGADKTDITCHERGSAQGNCHHERRREGTVKDST